MSPFWPNRSHTLPTEMNSDSTPTTLETVYDALALAIDRLGPEREALFLSKLALLMAHQLQDPDQALALIAEAEKDL